MDHLRSVLVLLTAVALGCKPTSDVARESKAPGPVLPSVTWDQPVELVSGGGHRGPWRQNDSKFHYVDDPAVAATADGTTVVVWANNKAKDVFVQVVRDGVPSRPNNVSRSPKTFSWLPRVVVSSEGREIFVLWQEILFGSGHGGEIFFARSDDAGASFSAPVNLSNSRAGCGKGRLTPELWSNGSLDLARSPDGTLVAAWTEYKGPLRVTRSTDGGRSFDAPFRLAGTEEEPARGPSLAVVDTGVIHLVWTVLGDLQYAFSTNRGASFSSPRSVLPSSRPADAPSLAVGRDDVLHLAFAREGSIYYARRDGAEFRQHRVIGSDETMLAPSLAADRAGHVTIVWEHRAPNPPGLGFTLSDDGGRSWSAPVAVPGIAAHGGYNGSLQGDLMRRVAVGGGRLHIANSTFVAGTGSRIYLTRALLAATSRQ